MSVFTPQREPARRKREKGKLPEKRRKHNPARGKGDIVTQRVQEIWDKMNDSERFGCQFAMFPAWVLDYKLSKEETLELIAKPKPNVNSSVASTL